MHKATEIKIIYFTSLHTGRADVECNMLCNLDIQELIFNKAVAARTSVVMHTDIPFPGRKPSAIIISVRRRLKGLLNGFIWIHCASAMSAALGQTPFSTCGLSAELLIRSENKEISPGP